VLPKYIKLISGDVFLHHVQAGFLMLKGKSVCCKRHTITQIILCTGQQEL